MPEYHVSARRIDSHGSEAMTEATRTVLDADMTGRADAFKPAEMRLASLAACMLTGSRDARPMHSSDRRRIEVALHGVRPDSPPGMVRIAGEIVVETDKTDQRIDLLPKNAGKYGAIDNTLAEATGLVGALRRES